MLHKPTPQPDSPEQFERFLDLAQEVEADEPAKVRATVERVLKKVALPKKEQTSRR
jgi:hypothetical protein